MLFSDHALTDEFLRRASTATKSGERIDVDNTAFRPGSQETVTMLMMMLALLQTGQPLPPEIERMISIHERMISIQPGQTQPKAHSPPQTRSTDCLSLFICMLFTVPLILYVVLYQ